jgi:6-pyruvoyltetrahydropterin/6-carboxytetrahydropterin synthase
MVTDFLHLSWLKKFFDDAVDHKFIIDINDPLFNTMIGDLHRKNLQGVYVPETDHIAGYVLDIEKMHMAGDIFSATSQYEYFESFFIVDFIPTSENLSKWVYDLVTPKMAKLDVTVGEVEWWETPKSCSRYSEPPKFMPSKSEVRFK